MSIYRSPAGRREVEQCYDAAREALSVDVDEVDVSTRHGETHLLRAGPTEAKPVFVFHGGNATNPMTLSWYADLADDYRLIAPDTVGQPGYSDETRVDPTGDAYGEWVLDLLDALDVESAPMVGTSYGAGIVLRAAALAPERIDRAALVVPAGFGTGPLTGMIGVGIWSMAYRYSGREWALDRALTTLMTEPDADPIARDTVGASLRHVDLEREFPTATAAELAEFDAPVIAWLAADDPFFPPKRIAPRVRERVPNLVDVQTLAGERHIISAAARARVTDRLREFLQAPV